MSGDEMSAEHVDWFREALARMAESWRCARCDVVIEMREPPRGHPACWICRAPLVRDERGEAT